MALGLITLNLFSLLTLAATIFYGIRIPQGGGAMGRHLSIALVAVLICVFVHIMTYFYFVGMGANIRRAVEEYDFGIDALRQNKRLKQRVMPWAFGATALLMITFILGGGAHTRTLPSWTHTSLGYLALLVSLAALLVEGYFLLSQNSMVNTFQKALVVHIDKHGLPTPPADDDETAADDEPDEDDD